MITNRKTKAFLSAATLVLVVAVFFQNCSKVAFEGDEVISSSVKSLQDHPPICNPLSGQNCNPGTGLIGNLYYMRENLQGPLFNNDLNNAKLNDYYTVGTKVSNPVIMNQINITSRSWESGFYTAAGAIVENGNGSKLFEWFALDLYGFIQLPSGTYQLGQESDDGMRVEIDGAVVLNDDGVHAPRWKCSTVSITGGTKHSIRVGYFQGPRNHISMNLVMRPASQSASSCSGSGNWQEIPASAFTH